MLPPSHERMNGPLLGMILFISSELMFFGSLFAAYYTIRNAAVSWPPPETPDTPLWLPISLTIVLLLSSVTQHMVMIHARRENAGAVLRWLTLTILLGIAFLVGEGSEWMTHFNEGFFPDTNTYGTLFFTITGFHGLHLFIGLIILILAHARAVRAVNEGVRLGSLEAATYYWHFVDVVWLVVVTSLFFIIA
jgi:cytochrome c oxidase subunit 3